MVLAPNDSMWVKATPLVSKMPSSGELLDNRQLKTTLPIIIKPPHNGGKIRATLQARQDYSRYDAHAKEKSNLLPTQPIWVQTTNGGIWSQGVIKSKGETPQSYVVQTPEDKYRRNREAAIPTTVPISTSTVNSSTTVQPIYKIPNNNKLNSNVSAECTSDLPSVKDMAKAEIKEPSRSSGWHNLNLHYIDVVSINSSHWYNKCIGYI